MKQLLVFLIISADFLITYLIGQFLINQFLLIRMHDQCPAIVLHLTWQSLRYREYFLPLYQKASTSSTQFFYIVLGKQDTIVF